MKFVLVVFLLIFCAFTADKFTEEECLKIVQPIDTDYAQQIDTIEHSFDSILNEIDVILADIQKRCDLDIKTCKEREKILKTIKEKL